MLRPGIVAVGGSDVDTISMHDTEYVHDGELHAVSAGSVKSDALRLRLCMEWKPLPPLPPPPAGLSPLRTGG